MIAQLEGTVTDIANDTAVISANGIGFAVSMPSTDLSRLQAGSRALVYTHLAVSQEGLNLYGFLDKRSKKIFQSLQKVSGIGPKAALALLSVMNADQLLTAISKQDVSALTRAKGVGKRGAQKVILELSGKIADLGHAQTGPDLPSNIKKVVEGLVSLGWHDDEAHSAVMSVMKSKNLESDIPDKRVPEVLRQALTTLGRRMQ